MLKVKSLAGAFFLLLLLNFIHPCSSNTSGKTVVVFQDGKTEVQYTDSSGQKTTQTPSVFNAPSFVSGMINNKEFLAIISSGRLEKTSEGDYTEGVVKTRYGKDTKWSDAERFTSVSQMSNSQNPWGDTTAVMKGNKIYVLITNMGRVNFNNVLRDPSMIVGTITNRAAPNSDDVYIQWGDATSLKDKVSQTVKWTDESKFIGGEGNGIVTTKGTIIFPIIIAIGSEEFASTLYSTDDGQTWLIGGKTESYTTDGSLVEWSDEKLLFVAASIQGFWKVFESNDLGITWKQSLIFFAVWGNDLNRQGPESPVSVITVPVDNKNVLLFAFPQNNGENPNFFDTLQLWLSDGQRIMCIGTISDESKETNTGHSVLAYIGENLYVTHQINPPGDLNQDTTHTDENWKNVIGLTPLPDFLENVKTTVREWRKLDDRYKRKGVPTDALVGFLGNKKTDNEKVWADMYNCVNATVNGGKIVDGGFQFSGAAGSGAIWPVASQGQNQVYKFTENQFTLAATVTIDTPSAKVAEKVPLIGAILDSRENNVFIDLGYTEDNKWYSVSHGKTDITTTEKFENGKEYHIALTFADGKAVVYVDGVEIAKEQITIPREFSISHFFMGGTGQSSTAATGNSCTVKNVMLLSRALRKEEMEKLAKISKDADLHTPIPTEKPTSKPENLDTETSMKPTRLPEGSTSVSPKTSEQTSVTNKQEIISEMTKGKGVEHSLRNIPNGTLEKHLKGADTAAVSFGIMPFMCFVCSVIVLAGF